MTTALTAYRLEMQRPNATQESATKAALDAVELTQLDYSDSNAAYFMKQGHMGGINRIPMQFRKYQQGMIYLLARNFKNAWLDSNMSPDEKAEAKKAFLYLMGTQLVMAGVRGVPIAMPLLFLLDMFGDSDDEEGDVETQLRNAMADTVGPEVARVFWKGLPSMMGIDAGSLSMERLLAPFPMMRLSDVTEAGTGKDAVTELIFNFLGAPVSLLSRLGDAVYLGSEGDYQKALEKILPKVIASPIKAQRLGSEGITSRSGNVTVEAEEFDLWDLTIKSLGFSPSIESEYYSAMMQKEGVSAAIDKRRNKIIKDFATSILEKEDVKELKEMVRQFNKEHPTRPITADSISRSIKSRVRGKAERDETGVRISKRDIALKDLSRFAR